MKCTFQVITELLIVFDDYLRNAHLTACKIYILPLTRALSTIHMLGILAFFVTNVLSLAVVPIEFFFIEDCLQTFAI